jgi:hypothetical protein
VTRLLKLVDEMEVALREAQAIYADLLNRDVVTDGRLRNAKARADRLLAQVEP